MQGHIDYISSCYVKRRECAEVHEAELLAELPRHLKGKIILHLLADIFDHSELFARLDQSTRSMLSAALIPRALLPGHDLCHPGDPARSQPYFMAAAATCLVDYISAIQGLNCFLVPPGACGCCKKVLLPSCINACLVLTPLPELLICRLDGMCLAGVIVAVQQGENVDVLYAPALLGEASLLTEQHPECTRRSCGFRAQVGPRSISARLLVRSLEHTVHVIVRSCVLSGQHPCSARMQLIGHFVCWLRRAAWCGS